MIEDNKRLKIGKACSIIVKLKQAELKYNRAQYRVSYYRKIKAALISKDPAVFLNRKNMKWRNNLKDLNKKIEDARLVAIKLQNENMAIRKKLLKPLNRLIKEIDAMPWYEGGKITGLMLNSFSPPCITLKDEMLETLAEEYEASFTLNKLLARK